MRGTAQNTDVFLGDKRFFQCIQMIVMLYWILWLRNSDSYYVIYLFIGIAGTVSFFDNLKQGQTYYKGRQWMLVAASALFALMTVAANYPLVLSAPMPEEGTTVTNFCYMAISLVAVLLGGFFHAWNIWNYLVRVLKNFYWIECEHKFRPFLILWACMVIILSIDLGIFFWGFYPGTLSPDSIWQIKQTMTNVYSNHHPFAHTVIIKIALAIGMQLFQDINKAVAFYSVCQIFFMASVFSYVIVTLYQLKISWKWLVSCLAWYALMPYHIMYSFTMWKDVAFGGLVTIFITAIYRILKGIGKWKVMNYVIAFVGSMGMCLFRSNGWFAFLITTVIFFFMYGKCKKEVFGMLSMVLILSFILLHPVLEYLDVAQPDTIEALSVPAQQIARVITNCNDLTEEQTSLLNKIVNTEEIASAYLPYIADPVKTKVREMGNQEYLVEHKWEFFVLWLKLGISHIKEYFEAWVDLTKGYWNGGYDFAVWSSGIAKNDLGIVTSVVPDDEQSFVYNYFWLYYNVPFLQVFISTGLFSWIVMGICIFGVVFKRRETIFLSIPLIAIIFSLLIATPVYAEFRYVYAIFTSVPLILFTTFVRQE